MTMGIIFLVLLIALAFAAYCWGFDSGDGIGSPEWQKRMSPNGAPHR